MNSEAIQEKSFLDCRVGNKFYLSQNLTFSQLLLGRVRNDANDNDKKRGSFRLPFIIYRLPHLAFTLAEVLITLTIIGVVAAATIPSLMQNTQDKEFKEAAKEAYSKTSQAIQQMKIDKDEDLTSMYFSVANQSLFYTDFMTYFKVIKNCGGGTYGCVPHLDPSAIYTNLSGSGSSTWLLGFQFITVDGMFISIYGNPSNVSGITITVDVNGYFKPPNVYGRDVFLFELINNNLFPMGAPGTDYPVSGNSCKKTSSGLGCMYYVMQGIDY